jgi:Tol biopolymer transport system component
VRSLVMLGLLCALAGCERVRDQFVRPVTASSLVAQNVQADSSVIARRLLSSEAMDSLDGDITLGDMALLPDGRRALAINWDSGDMVLVDLQARTETVIKGNATPWSDGFGYLPVVSPDGVRAAFWWIGNDRSLVLYEVDVAAGTARPVRTTSGPEPGLHAWMPGADSLLATRLDVQSRTSELILMPIGEGEPRVLRQLGQRRVGCAVFSPDGRYVLFDFPPHDDSPRRDILSIDLHTGREHVFAGHDADDWLLGWAPGTDQLLFASERLGTPGVWLQSVVNGQAYGTPVLVKPDFFRGYGVGFAADGSYLFGVQVSRRERYVAALDSVRAIVADPEPVRLQHSIVSAGLAAWSPDGSALAILSGGTRNPTLEVRELESRQLRTYPLKPVASFSNIEWDREGRRVLIRAQDLDQRSVLSTVDLRTGALTGTVYPVRVWAIALLPGGRHLVEEMCLPAPEPGGAMTELILLRDLETGAADTLRTAAGCNSAFLATSPGGNSVAFLNRQPRDSAGARARQDLVIMDLQTRQETRMPLDAAGYGSSFMLLSWAADGRSLFSSIGSDTARWVVRIQPDERVTFFRIPSERPHDVRVSPRGDRVTFIAGAFAEELWILENLPLNRHDDASAPRPAAPPGSVATPVRTGTERYDLPRREP